jgi:DNA helicase-2/ATP-dependent DNA helicase PcrA
MTFPSPAQDDVINCAIDGRASGLVVAGPGAGKSRCALEIARRILERVSEGKKVLFLSFSNAAIKRLSEGSGADVAGRPTRRRLVFATYHSLAAEVLAHYGQFVGLPGKTKVIDNLEERFIAISNGWDDTNKDNYRSAVLAHAKKTGELAFGVLVPLATSLLKTSAKLRAAYLRCFTLVIVDEFQDTSKDQWELLKAVGQDRQVLAFGDPNQIIYASLHEATAERLKEFEDWQGVERVQLPAISHRCKEDDILNFAGCLLSGKGYNEPEGESPVAIVPMYANQLFARLGAYCLKFLSKTKKSKLGILVPRNRLADEIVFRLRNPDPDGKVSTPVYARLPQNQTAIESIQFAVAALLDYDAKSNPATLRTAAVALCTMNRFWNPQAGTSQQNVDDIERCFTSTRMKKNSLARLPSQMRKAAPTTKGQARALVDHLQGNGIFDAAIRRILQNYPTRIPEIPEQEPGTSLFERLKEARQPQGLYGEDAGNNRIQVLTYQRSKGREFDFVIIVVDRYAESKDTPIEEKRRLYYVCATRAKQRLFVIHFGTARLGNVLGPVLSPTYVDH